MADKYLHRSDAPFSGKVWQRIDEAVFGAAKGQLCARRLLYVDGPYGLGLKVIPGADNPPAEAKPGEASVSSSGSVPVATIRAKFSLPARDIASFESGGLLLDLRAAVAAALACARQEDDLIFYGSRALGTEGLLSAKGVQSVKMAPWSEVGTAAEEIIKAVTKLDDAGFHGPYSLALSPANHNLLFRRYRQGNQSEMDHVREVVTDGIVKAPSIKEGGVLLASGRQYASIVLGQDLSVAYVGPTGPDYELMVTESLALRLAVPAAVCLLR